MTTSAIVLDLAIFDAVVLLLLGLTAAGVMLFGYVAEAFWDRVVPATAILVGSSVGAGVILIAGRWVSTWFVT